MLKILHLTGMIENVEWILGSYSPTTVGAGGADHWVMATVISLPPMTPMTSIHLEEWNLPVRKLFDDFISPYDAQAYISSNNVVIHIFNEGVVGLIYLMMTPT
jgi:hypothetical protein